MAVKGRVLAPTARTMKLPQEVRFVIVLWAESVSRVACGGRHSGKRAQGGLVEGGVSANDLVQLAVFPPKTT